MRSKKAAVWYYIILLGFILGLAAFYYYNAKFDPPEQSKIGNEIFKQVIERDLEISSIQYYIQESAKLSLIDSIYSIARKGGFYDNSPCGSYQGIPLLQTKDKGMDECTPNIEKELVSEFLSYLGSYLKNYKEDIGASHEYGVAIKFNKNIQLNAISINELMIPRSEEAFQETIDDVSFDYYNLTVYAQVECEESWENDENYNIKIHDTYSTEGNKYIFADVRHPNKGQQKPPNGEELYYRSMYKITNENALPAFFQILNDDEPGKYCVPTELSVVHNLHLTTYKNGKIVCQAKSAENKFWSPRDIKTWSPGNDANDDGHLDVDCTDSPSYLECPGIRAYYCGKTGPESFPRRKSQLPGWKKVESGKSYIDDNFVTVWQGNEPIIERPFIDYLHAKTSAKFLIDFDKKYTQRGASIKQDTWTNNFIQDNFDHAPQPNTPTYVTKSFRPSINLNYNYNDSDYDYIKSIIVDLTSKCSSKSNIEDCIRSNLKVKESYTLNLIEPNKEKLDRHFAFELITDKKFFPNSEPLIYKFATFIEDKAPSLIAPRIVSAPGEDKSIILSWTIPPESDIKHYNIYFSNDKLDGKKTQSLSKLSLSPYEGLGLLSDPKDCVFTNIGPCHILEQDIIYQSPDQNFHVIIKNLDNLEYYFAVTATDDSNKEIETIGSSIKFTPIDRLAPATVQFNTDYDLENKKIIVEISPPLTEMDGRPLNTEVEKYYIFAKKDSNENLLDITNLRVESKQITAEILLPELTLNDIYYLAVIATDSSENPIEKLSSTDGTKLIIKPEYEEILNKISS